MHLYRLSTETGQTVIELVCDQPLTVVAENGGVQPPIVHLLTKPEVEVTLYPFWVCEALKVEHVVIAE